MNGSILSVHSCNGIIVVALAVILTLAPGGTTTAGPTNFSTFVSTGAIGAAEDGQTNVIGFTFAGNKFVGSLYFGTDNFQLYSTNLAGGDVQKFGSPLPFNSSGGETVLAASLGQAGFAAGDIYASPGGSSQIYHYLNSGGAPTLFATVPDGVNGAVVRQIFFDPGNSFGGNMLVTTSLGHIYSINSSGTVSLVASIGEDTEGMDIATSAWGSFAGDLMVASEGTGTIRLVSPMGNVTVVGSVGSIPEAETVSFVPLNLNTASSLEGFYVANYPENIQFADASQFTSMLGDAVVTSEFASNAPVWDVHYNSVTNSFTISQIGNLPNQSEDGVFVTGQRLSDLSTPEPASLLLLGQGAVVALGLAWLSRRKLRKAAG